jgi:hypothetical protein
MHGLVYVSKSNIFSKSTMTHNKVVAQCALRFHITANILVQEFVLNRSHAQRRRQDLAVSIFGENVYCTVCEHLPRTAEDVSNTSSSLA